MLTVREQRITVVDNNVISSLNLINTLDLHACGVYTTKTETTKKIVENSVGSAIIVIVAVAVTVLLIGCS